MELIAYIGPMWSGKTTALIHLITEAQAINKKIGVFEPPKSNRGSQSDLSARCLLTKTFCPEWVLDGRYDMLFFDSVHLYDFFGNGNLFVNTLASARCKVVFCAGIYYNFYSDFNVFPVWNRLAVMRIKFLNLCSVKPCYLCGTHLDVDYTVNVCSPSVRVGDCYQNVCRSCGIQYRQDWKRKYLGTQAFI